MPRKPLLPAALALIAILGSVSLTPLRAQQHPSSAVPASILEERVRDATILFRWPDPSRIVNPNQDEEVRIWLGGGFPRPSMTIRILRMNEDSAIADMAMWWERGELADFIRQAVEDDTTSGCRKILRSQRIEGCAVHPPGARMNYADLLTGQHGDSLRLLVFNVTSPPLGAQDSALLIVEYRMGSRRVRRVLGARDSLNPILRHTFCIFQQATASNRPTVYADPFGC